MFTKWVIYHVHRLNHSRNVSHICDPQKNIYCGLHTWYISKIRIGLWNDEQISQVLQFSFYTSYLDLLKLKLHYTRNLFTQEIIGWRFHRNGRLSKYNYNCESESFIENFQMIKWANCLLDYCFQFSKGIRKDKK